ncbi:MAG: alpha-ketoglutarate-dependent dioxygenase AlkB [Acidimicrobiales bacterium]
MVSLQPSLLDVCCQPELGPLDMGIDRIRLGAGAWVDVVPLWAKGTSDLYSRLVGTVPWRSERRRMYDRVVDVPRLVSFYGEGSPLPDPVLDEMRTSLGCHYAEELGEPFATVGLCYYRDGRDSVAWHGDTIGRGATEDTVVAICSLGAPRRFLLRPRGGGSSVGYELGAGDLLVMGGSCQRTFEHSVPKTARPSAGRVSLQFRASGVR